MRNSFLLIDEVVESKAAKVSEFREDGTRLTLKPWLNLQSYIEMSKSPDMRFVYAL